MTAEKTLQRVLEEIGWEPKPVDGITGFVIDFGPPHTPIANGLAAISEDDQFVFYLNFAFVAAPERRDECARFIARANWGLTIGNFEMDYEDGQVRFKSSVPYAGMDLPEPMIRNAILAAMNAVDAYAEAVADVLRRGKTATEAMANVNLDEEA